MLEQLSQRVERLETHLGLASIQTQSDAHYPAGAKATPRTATPLGQEETGLEFRIGEFGLAYLGSVILFLGIVFLMAYTRSVGQRGLATIIGYGAAIGLYGVARVWSRSIAHLSRVMVASSFLLLYYTTMQLTFFSTAPFIENRYIGLALLLAVLAFQVIVAARRDSQSLAALVIPLAALSALLIDKTHVSLPIVVAASAVAVYLAVSRAWRRLLPVAILFAYAAHLVWLMGNPIVGRPLEGVSEHQYNLVYLFLYAAIFSLPALARKQSLQDDAQTLVPVLLNSLGFSVLMSLAVLNNLQEDFTTVYLGIACFFLVLSIIQWLVTRQQFTPAIYACFGYMALSVSIYGYKRMPDSFFWLSLQSLLVVSMALWFRSRTLVVMNSLIYVTILLLYFAISPSSNAVNFSFAIVALASARVMNWQKERLELRTDMLRNVYLVIAFVLVFYALLRAVPARYVALSWTATAVVYFLLSRLLGSIKYRWMAISAMLMTVVYLFLVDLAHLDPMFRVAAFIFFGLMALGISLFYARNRWIIKKDGN
jgi:hypothetical protein